MRFLFLALVALGCTNDATLAVSIQTDLVPGVDFETVRVSLETPRGALTLVHTATEVDYVRGQRAATFDGVEEGEFRVLAEVLAHDGRVVGRRGAVGTVNGITSVSLVVSRSCRAVRCPSDGANQAATECSGGRCVEPECSPENPAACGEGCAGDAECTSDVGCAAGVCNGEGACLLAPIVDACEQSEYCDVETGCQPRPIRMDGGQTVDAAIDAANRDTQPADAGSPDGGMECECLVPTDTCHQSGSEVVDAGFQDIVGCFSETQCSAISECPSGYACRGTACTCEDVETCGVTCTSDDNCDMFGLICDQRTNLCRAIRSTCLVDSTCPGDEACIRTLAGTTNCRPLQSGSIGDVCIREQECETGRCWGVCAQACTAVDDCTGGLICVFQGIHGACVTEERSPCGRCGPNEACIQSQCGLACERTSDCGEGEDCSNSRCVPTATPCGPMELRIGGACAIPRTCWPESPDCPAPYACNSSGICVRE